MGVYADFIIRQMRATRAEIQEHIDRVIGAEVARSKPFVFLPDSKAEGGGYFVDKRTGQIHDIGTWGKKVAIYNQVADGKLSQEEAQKQLDGMLDVNGDTRPQFIASGLRRRWLNDKGYDEKTVNEYERQRRKLKEKIDNGEINSRAAAEEWIKKEWSEASGIYPPSKTELEATLYEPFTLPDNA